MIWNCVNNVLIELQILKMIPGDIHCLFWIYTFSYFFTLMSSRRGLLYLFVVVLFIFLSSEFVRVMKNTYI